MDFQCPPVDDIIAGMDRCRIEVALLSSLSGLVHTDTLEDNLYVRKLVHRYPKRFRGLAVVTPYAGQRAAEELEACLRDDGFIGLKLHPWIQGDYGGADFLAPLLEICRSHSVPVVFHTGTPPYAQAYHIWVQARKFPRVTFVLAHLGLNYQWRDALEVGKMCSNTLFDTSGISYTFAIKRAVEELGPERVLFGSDNPFLFPETELQKVVTLGLDATALKLVLSENALRTFGLSL
jgi:predicted TIM-barrel fold metal-dependent hydrolase